MSYVLLLSRPILLRPLSSETLVWLLLVVAYGDSLTTSQAEVPLERIHAFYWEMDPFSSRRQVVTSELFIAVVLWVNTRYNLYTSLMKYIMTFQLAEFCSILKQYGIYLVVRLIRLTVTREM